MPECRTIKHTQNGVRTLGVYFKTPQPATLSARPVTPNTHPVIPSEVEGSDQVEPFQIPPCATLGRNDNKGDNDNDNKNAHSRFAKKRKKHNA